MGLKLKTDQRWVRLAEENLPELLTDHAWCEQKAASNAISMMIAYPELSEMVDHLTEIAREELEHFAQVHQKITARGWTLGRERKDAYVNDLLAYIRKGARETVLMDRLLFAAMIEARSCERFRLLSTQVADEELRQFYHDLMASEANHYTVFLNMARQYCGREATDTRWQQWLAYEEEVIVRYGQDATMHG